jgi:Zn-dependent peptidase ImmA (M78 family)
MLQAIGQIVVRRRGQLSRSVSELARAARVDLAHLESLERGEAGISTAELERLAQELDLELGDLRRGREVARAQPSIFLRQHPHADFNPIDHTLLDEAFEQGRSLTSLSRMLGLTPPAQTDRSLSGPRPDHDGYDLANRLRKALALGDSPLGDLRQIAERECCIAVVVCALRSTKVTAVSVRSGAAGCIVLNGNDTIRQLEPALSRVHLAHELCHLLFDPEEVGLQLVIDELDDKSKASAERRARAFAAELLLPAQGLRALLGSPLATDGIEEATKLIRKARQHFATPHEITVNHLVNCKFIDAELRETLIKAHTGQIAAEPMTLPDVGKPSLRVAELTQSAYQAQLLTDGQARTILGLDPSVRLPWERDDE